MRKRETRSTRLRTHDPLSPPLPSPSPGDPRRPVPRPAHGGGPPGRPRPGAQTPLRLLGDPARAPVWGGRGRPGEWNGGEEDTAKGGGHGKRRRTRHTPHHQRPCLPNLRSRPSSFPPPLSLPPLARPHRPTPRPGHPASRPLHPAGRPGLGGPGRRRGRGGRGGVGRPAGRALCVRRGRRLPVRVQPGLPGLGPGRAPRPAGGPLGLVRGRAGDRLRAPGRVHWGRPRPPASAWCPG